MPYVLGVDVGNGHTTAALLGQYDEEATVLPLDVAGPAVHTVLYLAEDDTVLVGRDALARAATEPDRVARGFLARLGDPVAPLVGGRPCPAEMLLAALVAWVVDRAVDVERAMPDRVVLAHPAGWGPYRRQLVDAALRQTGLPDVLLLPKPVAAAGARQAPVAVYDLGGHAFAGAVVRSGPTGFALVSRVEPAEHLGGTHFDDVLVAHVLAGLGHSPGDLDPFDDEVAEAMAQLRTACRTAKETLSTASEAVVPTPLFGPPSSVLVTRAQFEELIGPSVHRTVDLLRQVVRRCDPRPEVVRLVGGSARVPLVAELVAAAALGDVLVDPDPDTAVARGAALAARAPGTVPAEPPEQRDLAGDVDPDAPTQPPRPPVELAPLRVPRRGARRWSPMGRRTG